MKSIYKAKLLDIKQHDAGSWENLDLDFIDGAGNEFTIVRNRDAFKKEVGLTTILEQKDKIFVIMDHNGDRRVLRTKWQYDVLEFTDVLSN